MKKVVPERRINGFDMSVFETFMCPESQAESRMALTALDTVLGSGHTHALREFGLSAEIGSVLSHATVILVANEGANMSRLTRTAPADPAKLDEYLAAHKLSLGDQGWARKAGRIVFIRKDASRNDKFVTAIINLTCKKQLELNPSPELMEKIKARKDRRKKRWIRNRHDRFEDHVMCA